MTADLTLLHPALEPLAREWLAQCANAMLDARITETWRSPKREDELHAQGITPLTGATCKHCFQVDGKPASKAFDFALFDAAGNYIKDGTDPLYLQAGELGETIGLVWGGRWLHPDFDHMQLS